MAKRNNNPTGKGGFGDRPQDINRGGFTAEQRAEHQRQHDLALKIRAKQLDAVNAVADKLADLPEEFITTVITPAINSLIADAMDRNGGKPKQAVDLSSEDGTMTPQVIERVIVKPGDDAT